MLALILREAGWQPELRHRRRAQRGRHQRGVRRRRWLVVEADESDGTFLRLAPEAAIVTNVEPDHLDHYGGFDALVARVRAVRRRASRPASCAAPTTRSRPRLAADRPRRPHLRRARPAPTTGRSTTARTATACRVHARRATETPLGEIVVPVGVKAATNATGAAAMALELGVRVRRRSRARSRGFGGVARRFQYRGERDGVTFVDDYAHLPREVAAAIATAREAVRGPRRRRVPAAPLHAHGVALGGLRRRVRRRRRGRLTDVYAAGETPIAGVSGRLLVHAVADRHPGRSPSTYVPAGATSPTCRPRLARPATSCSPSAPATSRRCPTSGSARRASVGRCDGRRCARASRCPGRVERDGAERGAARRTAAAVRSPCSCASTVDDDIAQVATCSARPTIAVLVVGRGSNLLVADAGFDGVAIVARRRVRAHRHRPPSRGAPRPAGPSRYRCSPAARPRPGSAGLEFYVGHPRLGRRRGAHERRRPRPRDRATCSSRARVRRVDDGRARELAVADLELGYRRSALGDRRRRRRRRRSRATTTTRAAAASASTRSCGGGASTSPAARTPARCSRTRPATRPAGYRGQRLQGPAHRRARVSPRSTPTSSSPTRARPRPTSYALVREVQRTRRGRDRRPARARAPPASASRAGGRHGDGDDRSAHPRAPHRGRGARPGDSGCGSRCSQPSRVFVRDRPCVPRGRVTVARRGSRARRRCAAHSTSRRVRATTTRRAAATRCCASTRARSRAGSKRCRGWPTPR